MRINSNIAALNTLNQLGKNEKATNSSLAKLSSGLRINSAADDAAGLAISEKMKGQIRGLDKASSNSEDGISMVQTAEGALTETTSILQRMRELAVQSASDTVTDDDRDNIQDEMSQLIDEIDRISSTTQFNTKNLLDGSMSVANTSDSANILTNTALASATTGSALATVLTDDDGDGLGIVKGDKIKISWATDGKLSTTDITVASDTTLQNILDTIGAASQASAASVASVASVASSDNGTPADTSDDTAAVIGVAKIPAHGAIAATGGVGAVDANGNIAITARVNGYTGALGGLTFEVTDDDGNVKTDASNVLSSFSETTAAEEAKAVDGSATLQIGANAGQTMKVSIGDMGADALGVAGLDLSSQDGANVAITVIDEATSKVSKQRSNLGAIQNRLEHTINNLDTASENLSSAQSQIADVDMAAEMSEYTKNNVLAQAAQSMLAQANQQPQQVLALLQ